MTPDELEAQQERLYLLHGPLQPKHTVPTKQQTEAQRFNCMIQGLLVEDLLSRNPLYDALSPFKRGNYR